MKRKLSEVCKFQYGFPFDSSLFSDTNGTPVIRIRDIVRGFSETKTTETCSTDYIVDNDDILIGMDGEFNISKWKGGKAFLNQRVCKLIPFDVNKDYIFYHLPKILKIIEEKTSFVTVKHLSAKQLNSIYIDIPEQTIQYKIANVFINIDSLINKRKQQLSKLDQLVKSRFIEMFGDKTNTTFPKCKMREIASIKHGFPFSGEFFTEKDNNILLVTPGNFKIGGGFQEKKCKFFTGDYPEDYILHHGDLIVTMTDLSKNMDTLGYPAIVPFSQRTYLHNQRIGRFVDISKNINTIFLMYFMKTNEYRNKIISSATGSTVHHTSPSKILNCDVFIPPIDLQETFAAFVKQLDKTKSSVEQSLEKLETLKKSLLQEYFG